MIITKEVKKILEEYVAKDLGVSQIFALGQEVETGIITEIVLFPYPHNKKNSGCLNAHSVSSKEMIQMYLTLAKKGLVFAGLGYIPESYFAHYCKNNPYTYWKYGAYGRSPLGYFPDVPVLVLETDRLFWYTTTEKVKHEVQIQ